MIIAQSAAVSIGFVLDAIFGDPDFKLHPIRLIGYLISFLEKVMRRIFTKNERLGGAVMAICVLIICGMQKVKSLLVWCQAFFILTLT